jgi:ABC-type nitrate/sulfonate/bicarbonate transport system substrate-binding protein
MVFPSLSNLPSYVAQNKGLYAKRGLSVEILHTPNSDVLRDGLAKGDHQIVHAAVDNAVAMAEVAKVDITVVLGGDGGHNDLFVQPEINSYDDIRGKTVGVDAPNTAYALLLYKMLELKGVKKGEYQVKPIGGTFQRIDAMLKDKEIVASMLNPPFSIRAERDGLKNFGSAVAITGPYQAGAAWVLRGWAQANGDTLVKYIQAHIEGLRWALDPANKAEAAAILAERLRVTNDVAARSYEMGLDPASGFAKDAKFNIEGFRNVLKLRADILGTWGGTPPAPDKYLDMSYYERAVAGL